MDGNAGSAAPGSVAEYMKLVTAGEVVPARADEYITELVDAGLYETNGWQCSYCEGHV